MTSLNATRIHLSFGIVSFLLIFANVALCQKPEKISACQLQTDPAAFNQKLIEVTGFISQGFEDFTLSDPGCASNKAIWLEYGGTARAGTIYCCGVTADRSRAKQLEVEGMSIPLVEDQKFSEFDKLIHRLPDSVVHATIVGRFFAGRKVQRQQTTSWEGYGHFGCCSLLAIQQVLSVDPQNRKDVDYGASPDQPRLDKVGCGFQFLSIEPFSNPIEAQKAAENNQRDWAFTDPQRVAQELLSRYEKKEPFPNLKEIRKVQGRVVYEWKTSQKNVIYTIVVSRPYFLSFYSKDPNRVAWVVSAAYKSGCD